MKRVISSAVLRLISGLIALLVLGACPSRAANPGDLDLSFSPPANYRWYFGSLSVVGPRMYPWAYPTTPYHPLWEDGRIDSTWSLSDNLTPMTTLVGTAAGEMLAGLVDSGPHWLGPEGQLVQRGGATGRDPILFPREDGSVAVHWKGGSALWNSERKKDPWFTEYSTLGPIASGNTWDTRAVQDSRNRLILVGNFRSIGGVGRLGLGRLLPDGRPDPAWNPSPLLGTALTNGGTDSQPDERLNIKPVDVTLGTNDTVWISLDASTDGSGRPQRMVQIDDQGAVIREFESPFSVYSMVRCVQPDGRLLVGGVQDGLNNRSALIRLNPDGTVDPTFQVSFAPTNALIGGMELDVQGRLWICGRFSQVNGVARPGYARLFAYEPEVSPPVASITASPAKVGFNESLFLTARVSGYPVPALQWYRDGVPLVGETNRGLRLPVGNGGALGQFHLVATSPLGTNELRFPTPILADRSPLPGSDPTLWAVLPLKLGAPLQICPLPNGLVWVGVGPLQEVEGIFPMVLRYRADGTLDPAFGDGGVVTGNGTVRNLRPLATGGVLVAGDFTELAGQPAYGLAELDATGRRVARNFPELDYAVLTSVLPLPDGRYLIAGTFNQVAGRAQYRLARLKADLSPDPSFTSPVDPFTMVHQLELDSQGRILAAGGGGFPFGLARLLETGAIDPSFERSRDPVSAFVIEPDGTLLTVSPLSRRSANGQILQNFDNRPLSPSGIPPWTDQRLVGSPDGEALYVSDRLALPQLIRWLGDGRVDLGFQSPPPSQPSFRSHQISAVVMMPEGSLLVGRTESDDVTSRAVIQRLVLDPDRQLRNPTVENGVLRGSLATQTGTRYRIQSRPALNGAPSVPVETLEGDGFERTVELPVTGSRGFLEVIREVRRD
ncbi:MAG: hypothetical protein J0M24_05250 [Verrucomicrobia bacterium]|nr:hypothetical protein [Verrucomicrobiota bacterium]